MQLKLNKYYSKNGIMKKILLIFTLISVSLAGFSQTLEIEKQSIDSLLKSGTLSASQVVLLRNNWNSFYSGYKYPELPVNAVTKEVDFSDILNLDNFNKQIIFQRSLEWAAINYFNILYKDAESGKIIASGIMNLNHTAEIPGGFGKRIETPAQTSVAYTLILTVKDNKIKYNITNIEYTFSNYSETIDQITMTLDSLFPIIAKDKMQWKRYITALTETKDKMLVKLKNSLTDYIKNFGNDYAF
jgi:hypothetical protein